jgi:fatty acid desaturase
MEREKEEVVKRSVRLPIEMIRSPPIAWPTLTLFAAASALFYGSAYMGIVYNVSLLLTLPVQVLTCYALFTPMHDAAHNSVSSRHWWLNSLVGRLCSFAFLAPFVTFKYVHLQHHKYTNDAENDPDYYSEQGPAWQKPLRWATQELYYIYWYVKRIRTRPLAEAVETVVTFALTYGVLVALARNGFAREVLVYALLPVRGCLPVLALLFDWLPHHRYPHTMRSRANPYKATHKLKPLLGFELAMLTLSQSMHCIHHLWPSIAWYNYGDAWNLKGQELLDAGVDIYGVYDQHSKSW